MEIYDYVEEFCTRYLEIALNKYYKGEYIKIPNHELSGTAFDVESIDVMATHIHNFDNNEYVGLEININICYWEKGSLEYSDEEGDYLEYKYDNFCKNSKLIAAFEDKDPNLFYSFLSDKLKIVYNDICEKIVIDKTANTLFKDIK